MKPSTMARIALVILALGFVALMVASGHLDVILILMASFLVSSGVVGLICAAIGEFDQ